ncbi:hypothetical protein LTR28_005309 [Elasticomyces elasticus]|nr:hypothetical protein LTR28_005309 [Elasticomyces elasticus]
MPRIHTSSTLSSSSTISSTSTTATCPSPKATRDLSSHSHSHSSLDHDPLPRPSISPFARPQSWGWQPRPTLNTRLSDLVDRVALRSRTPSEISLSALSRGGSVSGHSSAAADKHGKGKSPPPTPRKLTLVTTLARKPSVPLRPMHAPPSRAMLVEEPPTDGLETRKCYYSIARNCPGWVMGGRHGDACENCAAAGWLGSP